MKVMAIDDNPEMIFILKKALQEYECELVSVTDSEKCLAMVKEVMPDLIFINVMMPYIDHQEICKKIKEDPKTSHIPVSMLAIGCENKDKIKSIEFVVNEVVDRSAKMKLV